MNVLISENEIGKESNFFRNYDITAVNILDIINRFSNENGMGSEEINNYLGIQQSIVRKNLARLINRIKTKDYVTRTKKSPYRYFKVKDFDPKEAYQEIINSDKEKVTQNQIGLKDSRIFDKLPYDGKICQNVLNQLKKAKSNWLSVCELAYKLGVDHPENAEKRKKSKGRISTELRRCMSCEKNGVRFVEMMNINGLRKFRLVYKYRKFTVEELHKIARVSFQQEKSNYKISGPSIQALNNVLMKGIE